MVSAKAKKALENLKIAWDFHNCISCNICPDCGGRLVALCDGSMGHGIARVCENCKHTFWKSNGGIHTRHTIVDIENL